MKASNVFKLIFGLFLIAFAIGIFQSLTSCKTDVGLYIIMMAMFGFAGIACILAAIIDYNKDKS